MKFELNLVNSQISEKEYLKNSNDISAKEKVKAFDNGGQP